eukprot:117_1
MAAQTEDVPTPSTSSVQPTPNTHRSSINTALSSSYNPLSHWGSTIQTLRNPYSGLSGSIINNIEEAQTSINNYHHPQTKQLQETIDKQRLEQILFAGDYSDRLNEQKERMREKLLKKLTQTKDEQKDKEMMNNEEDLGEDHDAHNATHKKRKRSHKKNKKHKTNGAKAQKKKKKSNVKQVQRNGHHKGKQVKSNGWMNGSMNGHVTCDSEIDEENINDCVTSCNGLKHETNGTNHLNANDEALLMKIESQSREMNVLKESVRELSKELQGMKERMNAYEMGIKVDETNMNSNHLEVREWLINEVQLEQYFWILIENGFEDMLTIKALNMQILDRIEGIQKIGHKLRILYFVRKLNQKSANNNNASNSMFQF